MSNFITIENKAMTKKRTNRKGFNMSLLEFFADKEDLIPATTETKELISMWSSLNQVQKDTIIQLIKSYKK